MEGVEEETLAVSLHCPADSSRCKAGVCRRERRALVVKSNLMAMGTVGQCAPVSQLSGPGPVV